jgi:hypothetical protein
MTLLCKRDVLLIIHKSLWFSIGSNNQEELLNQGWLFFYAYSIYYNLFTVKEKFKHNNYFERKINKSYFSQVTEHDKSMHANFGDLIL